MSATAKPTSSTSCASKPAEGGTRYGNVKDKRDLVLHLGDTADSPVGVVLEVKGPKNPKEMLAPDDLNRKALHQLLLYYLEDRTDDKADDFRRLIVTTGYEWYVFDALDFNRLFWKDKGFVKDFLTWKAGAKAATDTDFFYKSIAGRKLAALEGELPVVYVDLRPGLPTAPAQLTALYRLFHPAYLLKEPLTGRRDPNTLNQEFYHELLYLMGLREDKQGGVRKIGRCPEEARQPGSLLENTLRKLETGHGLNYVPEADRLRYGDTAAAQREGVALALCLMWVNRLLFLKLLEGQLVRYHAAEHAAAFRFLHPQRLSDYDEVQTLFFEVLNRAPADRTPDVLAAFPEVPYLNSSLFEPSELEGQTLDVSGLRDGLGLTPFPGSVLGRKGAPVVPTAKTHTSAAPQWAALPYLLHFLDAYDFATDPTTSHAPAAPEAGAAPVAPAARPLLSAAVLGLVFEKINGYKDGSFYTPGFVTMYMARQTLGRAVVRHFRNAPDFPELGQCDTLDDLLDTVAPAKRPRRRAYAAYFNTLTVLDPAVGSGHFLVSALNELLALKSRLGLFLDEEGAALPYTLEVEHDELVVTDHDGQPAPYRVGTYDPETGQRTVGPERTRLQQALFREKRALMEHALFGVDLNPNSVRICRLRLWIELLKHAYYKPDTQWRELETLPNLDLNVKTGNSLLARFPLDADLSEVFQKGKFSLKEYREGVHAYFGSRGRDDKARLLGFFQQLKEQFTAVLHKKDKKREELRLARNKIIVLSTQTSLLPETKKEEEARHFAVRQLELRADQLQADIDAHEQGALYRDAFEWRFEFPEVLDDAGRFRGFDVVLGNPPYVRADKQSADFRKVLLVNKRFVTLSEKWDLFVPFLELSYQLLKPDGEMSMIVSDAYCHAKYAKTSQEWFLNNATIERIDFLGLLTKVFPEANVNCVIPTILKRAATKADEPMRRVHEGRFDAVRLLPTDSQANLTHRVFFPGEGKKEEFEGNTVLLERLMYISKGMVVHANESKAKGQFILDDLVSNERDAIHPVAFSEGKNLERWLPRQNRWLEWGTERAPALFSRPTFPELYQVPEKLISSDLAASGKALKVTYDNNQLFHNHSAWSFVPWHSLADVRNKSLQNVTRYANEKPRPDLPKREVLEEVSRAYSILYLLGVMNSTSARDFLRANRRSNIHLYPDDWKQLPIPAATAEEQAAVAALVAQVLAAKAAAAAADTQALEAQIDALVAALYGVALPAAPVPAVTA